MRERMVNLKLFNYVFSSSSALVLLRVQCTVLLGIVFSLWASTAGPSPSPSRPPAGDHRHEQRRDRRSLHHRDLEQKPPWR